eukprot:2884822-Rhodomonas_salina.4
MSAMDTEVPEHPNLCVDAGENLLYAVLEKNTERATTLISQGAKSKTLDPYFKTSPLLAACHLSVDLVPKLVTPENVNDGRAYLEPEDPEACKLEDTVVALRESGADILKGIRTPFKPEADETGLSITKVLLE